MREAFEQELQRQPELPRSHAMLATRQFGFMFIWYALLWAVLEGCIDRKLDFRGRLQEDIERLSDTLRPFRNAIFHVPRDGDYVDKRLMNLVEQPNSALAIRRLNVALGRLFFDEFQRRKSSASTIGDDYVAPN
jgi:hypothetical protein